MVVDREIQLIFKVQILDEKQLFHFFRVLPIPIFSNDILLKISVSHPHCSWQGDSNESTLPS
jgi:hypothetical protein